MDLCTLQRSILSDPLLSKLTELAKAKKTPIYLVGGYPRDLILGIHRKDYDLAIPQEAFPIVPHIEEALQVRFFTVGKEQTHTVSYRTIKEDLSLDLAFLQGATIEEDLRRRDFSINAMAFSLLSGEFHAVEGALDDLEKGVIRTVSSHAIDHDPLRMLRAVRYLSTLPGFRIEEGLKTEIRLKKELLQRIPGERIKAETDQILLSYRPALGVYTLHELSLLLTLFPELKGLQALGQGRFPPLDILSHTLLTIDKLRTAFDWLKSQGIDLTLSEEERLALYYGALFHDIGKRETYSQDEQGKIHFYHHESFSCQAADKIMQRLRFSNALKHRVLHLVQNHMRILTLSEETKEGALKRLINQIGEEIPLLILLALADREASFGILPETRDEWVERHCLRILQLYGQKEVVHPPRLITGDDLIALGYAPGPKVGEILARVRERQLEGEINTRDEALRYLRERFG